MDEKEALLALLLAVKLADKCQDFMTELAKANVLYAMSEYSGLRRDDALKMVQDLDSLCRQVKTKVHGLQP